jgi:antitoxin VapB
MSATAKIFMHGRSQAVRLPKEFRLPGKEVKVSRVGRGVLLEPVEFDVEAWLKRINDAAAGQPFPKRAKQARMPRSRVVFK